jgi:hypothetical protein
VITILAAAALSGVSVDAGRFDQSQFPNATRVERRLPDAELTRQIDNILASGQCRLQGQTRTHYDILVPYAVLMQPSGEAVRVVVKDIGCAPIETLVGQVATELSRVGDFRPTHQEGEHWYVSEAHFSRLGGRVVAQRGNQNKVICRAAEAKTGSRLAAKRDCRTVAEWELHDAARAQFQGETQDRVRADRPGG